MCSEALITSRNAPPGTHSGVDWAWLVFLMGLSWLSPVMLSTEDASRESPMPKKKRRRALTSAHQEAVSTCDSCGEEIVVPVDISAGSHQDYVEDCPVCCHPMTLHVDRDPDGEAHVAGGARVSGQTALSRPANCGYVRGRMHSTRWQSRLSGFYEPSLPPQRSDLLCSRQARSLGDSHAPAGPE